MKLLTTEYFIIPSNKLNINKNETNQRTKYFCHNYKRKKKTKKQFPESL